MVQLSLYQVQAPPTDRGHSGVADDRGQLLREALA
jgi:hypothetical protein